MLRAVRALAEVADGIWSWAGRHPEWHPGQFGADVRSYALATGDALLLVDPLVGADDEVPADLDELARDRAVHVLVTIGYHVRSAETLAERFGARVLGPPQVRRRLADASRFAELAPTAPGPCGVTAFAIGRPPRGERPLWFPSHGALAFGDALVVTPDGELRLWTAERVDAARRRFFAERFAPTLAPLLELPVLHVLATHGEPVTGGGGGALRDALAREPWYHRG